MSHPKSMFSPEDLKAITAAIQEAEKKSSGEIRVEIRQQRKRHERSKSIEEIARREFHTLGMMNTRDRTGILILLILKDRQFHILADEGIHKKVEEGTWEVVAQQMEEQFKRGAFRDGLIESVQKVGDVLARHFPHRRDDQNELPDDVRVV